MLTLSESAARRYGPWLILALGLLLLLPATGNLPLLDRDEPRFSGATIEMMERGNYVVPYFNDGYRFDKPPLTYWWMALHYRLFGFNEFGARLHAVLATLVTALAVYGFGRSFASARTGLFAALGYLTCLQVLIHGRLALADMPLIAAITVCQWALWQLLAPGSPEPRRFGVWYWVLWLSCGIGLLAKGPLAFLVPGLGLVLYRFAFHRRAVPWSRLQPLSGCVVALFPVAVWGIPALVLTNGAYWDVGIGTHVIDRGLGAFNDRISFPFYYFLTVGISLLPWLGWFWVWQRRVRRDWDPLTGFLLSWFLAPFVIFSLYATQLPHYILPGFPAFFLLLFRRPFLPSAACRTAWQRWHNRVLLAAVAVALLLTIASGLLWYQPRFALGLLGVLGAVGAVFWWSLRPRPIGPAFAAAATIGLGLHLFGAGMRDVHATIRLASALEGEPGKRREGTGVGYHFSEPSLVFYTGRFWDRATSSEQADEQIAARHPAVVVTLEQSYETGTLLLAGWQRDRTRPDRSHEQPELPPGHSFTIEGLNPARFSWVRLGVWVRAPATEAGTTLPASPQP